MNNVTRRDNVEGNSKNIAVKALQNSCKSPAEEMVYLDVAQISVVRGELGKDDIRETSKKYSKETLCAASDAFER